MVSTVGMADVRSAGDDVDDDGCRLGEGVVHGRPATRLLDDAAQRLLVSVAFDPDGHPALLVAVAYGPVRQAEDPDEVDVALDRGLDLGEGHAAGGGDVADAGG